jgi:repressor LexA
MGSDENVSKILRKRRENLKLSMQEVSNLTGISVSHISRIEKGVRLPGYKIFEKLNELYGRGNESIISNDEKVLKEISQSKIPLIEKFKAGVACQKILEYIEVPHLLENTIDFALKISDDSMNELNIKNCDIVFIRQQTEVENGEIAVILIDDKDAIIKQYYHHGNNITLIPRSKNPKYCPLVYNALETDIKVIGKVVSAYILV